MFSRTKCQIGVGCNFMENAKAERIEIPYVNRPSSAKSLNDLILKGKRRGCTQFSVYLSSTEATYSNVLAPIAGILYYYRQNGMTIECDVEEGTYIAHTCVTSPLLVQDYIGKAELASPLDRVWQFSTADEIYELLHSVIRYVRESDTIQKGVIRSIEWCLNETLDNILQHSQSAAGFFMGQLMKAQKTFSFCVFDCGRGIYNSLKPSIHCPSSAYDAITMAMQERITRDNRIGQGNGLWGFSELIRKNNGYMRISSHGATYTFDHGQERNVTSGDFNLGPDNGTVLIDCQLNYDREIDVTGALKGYDPGDTWLDRFDELNGEYRYVIADISKGTGTRVAAERARNIILNGMEDTKAKAIIDFAGVNTISSSYADELIGKILIKIGFVAFLKLVKIENVSSFISSIINRSVQQRMAQQYYDESITDDEEATKY